MTAPATCALALSGGVAKGAFHAGVLRAFAEFKIIPSAIVGTSAGALNGAYCSKLIAEDRFTPYWVERVINEMWLHQTSLQKLWASHHGQDNSLRSLVGTPHFSLFMLRRAMDWLSPARLRELLQLRFTSVLSDRHFKQQLEQTLTAPQKVLREVHFAASITSLTGQIETTAGQPLVSYGDYLSFHLHPEDSPEQLAASFERLRTVVRASSSFPGMFPPVPWREKGRYDLLADGGLTKNSPFGRAIKLNPDVRTIFLISCMPITQPTSGRMDHLLSIMDQVYNIVLNKELASDFRKIQQINARIEKLHQLLQRDSSGAFLDNPFNQDLLDLAGFEDLASFLRMRTVEIVIIEPPLNLEGDPFAGFYRSDRVQLLERYIALGYDAGCKVLKRYLERTQT